MKPDQDPTGRSADQIARACADAMWARDQASKWLGMELVDTAPGTATLRMAVAAHHTNGHDICHGGFIFTLADSAFAFACNSYNQVTVAQTGDITFVAPGKLGDVLTATAHETARYGRSGIYDVTVINQNGDLIAEFRGRSRTIKGVNIPEEQT